MVLMHLGLIDRSFAPPLHGKSTPAEEGET